MFTTLDSLLSDSTYPGYDQLENVAGIGARPCFKAPSSRCLFLPCVRSLYLRVQSLLFNDQSPRR